MPEYRAVYKFKADNDESARAWAALGTLEGYAGMGELVEIQRSYVSYYTIKEPQKQEEAQSEPMPL